MENTRLERIVRRQKGLFTRDQAMACGFSPGQMRRRIAAGRWRVVIGSVLAAAGLRVTAELRDRAAQLAVTGSVLAGPSAARLWRMDVDEPGTLLVVGRRVTRSLPGVRLKQDILDSRDLDRLDGVPVTSRARTVFDCLRLLPERHALDLLDRALLRQWITLDDLVTRLHYFVGRHGAKRMVGLIRTVSGGARFAAERLAAQLLRRAGIVGWVANAPIRDEHGLIGLGDLVFRDRKLLVEIDGWAYHVTPEQFQRDRQRQNRLVAAGWTVLRFTWRDLTERPTYVIATIRAML